MFSTPLLHQLVLLVSTFIIVPQINPEITRVPLRLHGQVHSYSLQTQQPN